MRIEILYPQLCCLYGDKGNTVYLQKCFPDAEFIFTQLNDKPAFLDGSIDLCCMYSLSEQNQEKILARLMPYRQEIQAAFSGNTQFLLLGNAMELFGQYICTESSKEIPCLGVFPTYTIRHAPKRFNTLIQANFKDMVLLGYSSRFSDTYGITQSLAMAEVTVGYGSNPTTKLEGIYTKNVIATYLLGPLLVANPDFTKWLMKKLGVENPVLPYAQSLYQAYEAKRKEFLRSDLELD